MSFFWSSTAAIRFEIMLIHEISVDLISRPGSFQAAMLPPSLYSHLKCVGKDMIVVLNKVDLVPLPVAIAWKHSLLEAYPGIRSEQCLNISRWRQRQVLSCSG